MGNPWVSDRSTEAPGSPPVLEQSLSSLSDDRERCISHSLYGTIAGLDDVSAPRGTSLGRMVKIPPSVWVCRLITWILRCARQGQDGDLLSFMRRSRPPHPPLNQLPGDWLQGGWLDRRPGLGSESASSGQVLEIRRSARPSATRSPH
ncbi:unnamed protein product [Arctogadus glacialis]